MNAVDRARTCAATSAATSSASTRSRPTSARLTFKHVLLPVWLAAYRYRGKSFRFVVNGRTGSVEGERPWSSVQDRRADRARADRRAGDRLAPGRPGVLMRRPLAAALLILALPAASRAAGGADRGDRGRRHPLHRRSAASPAILDGYRVTRDLNGDGVDDFLTDLARLECGGAWSAFCGSSGCPVTAWLSEPAGGHARFELGRLLGFELRDAEPLPALVARYAAPFCAGADVEDCTRTWTFASNSPETPPIDPPPEPEPGAGGSAGADAGRAGRARPSRSGGRRLDAAPGAGVEPGGARPAASATSPRWPPSASSGEPFLAVTFHERPEADDVALAFAFGDGAVRGFRRLRGDRGRRLRRRAVGRPARRAAGGPRQRGRGQRRRRARGHAFARRIDPGDPRRARRVRRSVGVNLPPAGTLHAYVPCMRCA